jgi:cytochrome c oxidase cbb3-type subunit 1
MNSPDPSISLTEIPLKAPASVTDLSASDVDQVERALIDASTRVPVLMFYTSAVAWLLLGTVLAGFTSFKLHSPDLLSNVPVLTWGRIRPAHVNVMLYGWASMVGIGTAIWLMARLCRTTLRHPLLIVAGGVFWNLGVVLGVGGILAGDSTGYNWIEFPSYAAIVLFVAYSLIVSWAVLMFRFRRGDPIYITQWYLLAAFLWFPWIYLAAQTMLFIVPVQGVLQAAVAWWYANNLLFLWFGSLGLGTAYYMIPKVTGRPVYSYHLAAIGFWSYALFASWTGMQRLIDGPFPAWMITASIAAMILSIIPVATVGLNHHMTMRNYFPLMRYSPTLRFTVFGAMSYTAFSVLGTVISLRSFARFLHFSEVSIAYSHLGLYAFFSMIMFGAMYYIVPRLVGREWRYSSLIKLHFWSAVYGIALMTLMLLVGGLVQGLNMDNPTLAFTESTQSVLPYLRGRTLSGLLMAVAHFVFAYHFGLMLFGLGRTASVPTFLNPVEPDAEELVAH